MAPYVDDAPSGFGLDWPAFIAAAELHSAMTGDGACIAATATARGQLIVAGFVFPLWFGVGASIRRIARRDWRATAKGRFSSGLPRLCSVPAPLAVLALVISAIGLLFAQVGMALQAAGIGCWLLYRSALAAERLRVWPFHQLD
jgi:hypothetical protein